MGETLKNLINLGDKSRNSSSTSVTTSVTAPVTSQADSTASETVTSPASASVSSEDDGYGDELDSQSSSSLPLPEMTSNKQSLLSVLKGQNHVSKNEYKQIQWENFMANNSELQVSPYYNPILPNQALFQLPASPKGVRNPHHLSSAHFDPGGVSHNNLGLPPSSTAAGSPHRLPSSLCLPPSSTAAGSPHRLPSSLCPPPSSTAPGSPHRLPSSLGLHHQPNGVNSPSRGQLQRGGPQNPPSPNVRVSQKNVGLCATSATPKPGLRANASHHQQHKGDTSLPHQLLYTRAAKPPAGGSDHEILMQKFQDFICPLEPGGQGTPKGGLTLPGPDAVPVRKLADNNGLPTGKTLERTPTNRLQFAFGNFRNRDRENRDEGEGGEGHVDGHGPPGGNQGHNQAKLVIKINPSDYGVNDPDQQMDATCRQPFLKYLKELFEVVKDMDEYEWFEQKQVQHFLGMVIARIVVKGPHVPGAVKNHHIDDLFEYDGNGVIQGTGINYGMNQLLSGVSYSRPSQFFTPCDHIEYDLQPCEAILRPAIVKAVTMIQDLLSKRIEVEVQYTFGIDIDTDDPHVISYSDDTIKAKFYDAALKVAKVLDTIFNFQSKADELADCLEALSEDRIENFEAVYCDYVVSPELANLSDFKNQIQTLHQGVNQLKKVTRMYEHLGDEIYEEHCLTATYATLQFKNQSNLIKFLRNDSSDSTPWIRFPRQWTAVKSQINFNNETLKVMAGPSRLYVHRVTTPIDSIASRAGDLVKKALEVVTTINQNNGFQQNLTRNPTPEMRSAPRPAYPNCLVEDASKFIQRLQDNDKLESASANELSDWERNCSEMIKGFQQAQWKEGIVLHQKDKDLCEQLHSAKAYIVNALTKRKEEEKLKEVEAREISKSLAATKAPTLSKDAKNIMDFLNFHETYKNQNPLARCMRIREGLPEAIKERVLNETDPDKILSLLKRLYMAEDVILPLARAEIQALPNSPSVNSATEGKAYTCILNFINKLQKADLFERLDFSTITLAASKLSKIRQDTWDKEWLLKSMRLEGTPLRHQEETKRDMFVEFLNLHDNLLQRKLVQNSLADKPEKEKEKSKSSKTFSTNSDLRETRYDKKRNKNESGYGERNRQTMSNKAIVCVLCKKEGGHPNPKFGKGGKSLARCPEFAKISQGNKISQAIKLGACLRCLYWGHSISECLCKPSADFLKHDDCDKGNEGVHHPLICSKRRAEKSFSTKDENTKTKSGIIFNLLEQVNLKTKLKNSPTINARCVFDNCSDSNWISSSLANRLPKHKVEKVQLNLTTIPQKGNFETKEHSFLIKVKDNFRVIKAYETCSIGTSTIDKETIQTVRTHFRSLDPLHISSGNIDLLIGLADYDLHPSLFSSSPIPNMKIFTSATAPKTTYLLAGTLPAGLMGGAGPGEHSFFTISDLYKSLLQDQSLDLPPAQCEICRQRSKKCYKCCLISKPMSLKEQFEFDLVTKPMVFNKKDKTVTTKYLPTTKESFKELFPPEFSNRREATAIAKKTLRTLKRNNQVDAFQQAFQKMVDDGTFVEISDKELEQWDNQGLPSNFVSLHPVKKLQSDPSKLAFRIVTNSSLNRLARVGGKVVKTSLNAVLPQASYKMNTLPMLTLGWLEKEVSVLMDMEKAYNTIIPEASVEGRQMVHLRRIVYWEDPNAEESELVPKIFGISKVHFGDSCSSAILENLRQQVADDLRENDLPETSDKLVKSSFVDDNCLSVSSVEEAFKFYKDCKDAFSNYGAKLHEPVISSHKGCFVAPNEPPRTTRKDGEEEYTRIFGFLYDEINDEIKVPIQKNFTKRRQGIKVGADMTPEQAMNANVTMRMMSSALMSFHDFQGFLTPVLIRGRILLSKIQEVLSPSEKGNWDCVLPDDLLLEAQQFLSMMIKLPEPVFKRSPPPGVLKELHAHVDGAEKTFATVVYGVWVVPETGERSGKLLFSKPKISKRNIPDNELSAMWQGTQVIENMLKVYKTIEEVHIFGDSECTNKMLSSKNRPKDVYKANRINAALANIQEIKDNGANVSIHLVKSEDNASDICTKFKENAPEFLHSKEWKEGPAWLKLQAHHWPVVKDESGNDVLALATTVTQNTTAKGESTHLFSQTLNRCSNVNKVARVIARVKSVFQSKSFKSIRNSPSTSDTRDAFHTLVALEQTDVKAPKSLMPYQRNGLIVTSQRWTQEDHINLFGVPYLPVLLASSRLADLLLHRAHRPIRGPCRGDRHCWLALRTGNFACFLFGKPANQLRRIKSNCVECTKRQKEGYSAPMQADRFKRVDKLSIFSNISIDMMGPLMVSNTETQRNTRNHNRWAKKYVLIISDNSGVNCVNLVPMQDASASSFALALQTHIQQVNRVPDQVFSDDGTNFLAVAKRDLNEQNEAPQIEVSNSLKEQFPNIQWSSAGSSSQYRNGQAENFVRFLKKWIKGVFNMKPGVTTLPKFTNEGLLLVLAEAKNFLNSRPLGWFSNSQGDTVITPNHFLTVYSDPKVWVPPKGLEDRYNQLEEYRGRMFDELKLLMQTSSFLPSKWYSQGLEPHIGDVVFYTRQKSKVNPSGITEYARIEEVSADKRNLKVRVTRNGVSKSVNADARLCMPLVRNVEQENRNRKQISEMDANQGKFDIIAGAHDDVQAQETAGDQTSQVANIENDTGAHQDAQSKEASPGDLSTQVTKFENDAGAQKDVQNEEASPGDLSAQVAKD